MSGITRCNQGIIQPREQADRERAIPQDTAPGEDQTWRQQKQYLERCKDMSWRPLCLLYKQLRAQSRRYLFSGQRCRHSPSYGASPSGFKRTGGPQGYSGTKKAKHLTSKFRTRPKSRCAWRDHYFPVFILTKRPHRVHGGQVFSLRRLTRQRQLTLGYTSNLYSAHETCNLHTKDHILARLHKTATKKGPDIQNPAAPATMRHCRPTISHTPIPKGKSERGGRGRCPSFIDDANSEY